MRTSYVVAPPSAREWWDADGAQFTARTVFEPEPKAIDTGLLNARGQKLFRVEKPEPIGFRRPGQDT